MKKITLFIASVFAANFLFAQQWAYTPSTNNNIYNTNPGNVGIGTTTPAYPLVVAGSQYALSINPSVFGVDIHSSGNFAPHYQTDFVVYHGNIGSGVPMLDINSVGNVGIGVTNQSDKLTIDGTTRILDGANIYLQAPATSAGDAGDLVFQNASGIEMARIFSDPNGGGDFNFSIGSTSSTKMLLTRDGNLAIGTTNPQGYRLAVNGDAIFTSVKVKLYANWPDYVFQKKYSLLTLDSLEKYIAQNDHLPGMPSAQDIRQTGNIDLGQMNTKLLEKVEELTLYLIQLKKENEEIKAELKKVLEK